MAVTFEVRILTPERSVFTGQAEHLLAPGSQGYLGILAHHAPLMTGLRAGSLSVRTAEGVEHSYRVEGGFLEVSNNSARVLADSVEGDGDSESR